MKFIYRCPILKMFDVHCAGCGGTRMFLSLLKLDYYQAFRYNSFLFCLLVIGVVYGISAIIMKLLKKKIYVPDIKWIFVVLGAAIVFMILRNIPGFEFLLPTEV